MGKGYKKTEIGVIPMEWEVEIISSFSNPVRGGSPRPAGDARFFNGNYIPWLTVASLTNIPESQIYVEKTESFLTEEGSHHSRILQKGTLIISNSGATLGVSKLLSIKCCANDGIAALLDIDKDVESKYLVYFLNTKTDFFRNVVATGNGQPNLNTDLIGNFSFPLPPLPEQTAIATVLSDTDSLIQALEKKIAKKQLIKKGAMQKLLSPKEGWVVKLLSEAAEFLDGQRRPIKANERKSGDYPYYGASGIIDYVNAYIYDDELILLGEDGENILSRNLPLAFQVSGKIWVNNHAHVLKPKEGFNIDFLTAFLESLDYSLLNSGTAQPKLNKQACLNINVIAPPIKEQIHIAQILSDMDNEIEILKKKLAKYKLIKQGLMQVLLTGKIRLV